MQLSSDMFRQEQHLVESLNAGTCEGLEIMTYVYTRLRAYPFYPIWVAIIYV